MHVRRCFGRESLINVCEPPSGLLLCYLLALACPAATLQTQATQHAAGAVAADLRLHLLCYQGTHTLHSRKPVEGVEQGGTWRPAFDLLSSEKWIQTMLLVSSRLSKIR